MPHVQVVPIEEVLPKTKPKGPSEREVVRREYDSIVAKLTLKQALILTPSEKETPSLVKTRTKSAAQRAKKNVVARKVGGTVKVYQTAEPILGPRQRARRKK